ncbi:hypothetical protein V1264_017431 [Littorina saxatilis]|uniref:Ig-like domain-containing protein n=2 Tax=Littorina saxatilis TaxID=31220 RepID=A0AAN9BJ68_9CAEN
MIATTYLGVVIPSFIVLIESQVCPHSNTWECNNGECIWYDRRCDGDIHCDGSDENNCENWKCSENWWKCGDYKCIWNFDRCTGTIDCTDGSDERNCERWHCLRSHWKCGGNTLCITISARCNGADECADGSDEEHCDVSVARNLTVDGHNDTITVDGDGRKTLIMKCRVFGRVKTLVTFKKESVQFGNVSFPPYTIKYRRVVTWTYDAALTLSDVTCEDTGRYTCTVGTDNNGYDSKSIQLNVNCSGKKYGGKLTCPFEWYIGKRVKLTLTLDRSKWPFICRTDPDRREAWFEVIRWNDTGRQSTMCTVVNITSPEACQGAYISGTIGCGCVKKTKWLFILEFNFVMNVSLYGNWSVDTYCLRTDFSEPIKFHVTPECNVRPEPPPRINPSSSEGGAGGPVTTQRGQTNVTLTCGIAGRTIGVCWCFCPTSSPDLVQE